MLCEVTHCAGHFTNPHPLCWDDREMGTAISCKNAVRLEGWNKAGRSPLFPRILPPLGKIVWAVRTRLVISPPSKPYNCQLSPPLDNFSEWECLVVYEAVKFVPPLWLKQNTSLVHWWAELMHFLVTMFWWWLVMTFSIDQVLPQICMAFKAVLLNSMNMLYYPCKSHSREGARFSKLWPYARSWAKNRGWTLFCAPKFTYVNDPGKNWLVALGKRK